MRQLATKAARLASQNIQFELLIKSGYVREDYNGLMIFTNDDIEMKRYQLKVFRNNSSNHIAFFYYRSIEDRNSGIARIKANQDSRIAYKEKQKENKQKSPHAMAASTIRTELKSVYPNTKFEVKSDCFSGGDAVRVAWIDGPTVEMLDNVVSKYQYGHFNGMEDIYVMSNNRNDIPQTKYVSTSRTMSQETRDLISKDIVSDEPEFRISNLIYRKFVHLNLYK